MRRARLDEGDQVVVNNPLPFDPATHKDEQGNANLRYARLLHRANFSLVPATTSYLSKMFPGMFFAASGNENHSHPKSHVISDVVHRFALRRLPPGSRILEIGGIPKKAREFNAKQSTSTRGPKHLDVLVDLFSPKDFRRCIDKWGPQYTLDNETDPARPQLVKNYLTGRLRDLSPEVIASYDVFLFHHTGYYYHPEDYMHIFRNNETARVVITTLKHDKKHGTLNDGELTYDSLPNKTLGMDIVKQVNTFDGEVYCHPNIYKWFNKNSAASRQWRPANSDIGFSWEITPDCDDNYTIQMSSFRQSLMQPSPYDYEALFREAEDDDCSEPAFIDNNKRKSYNEVLPTPDGHFVELNITPPPRVEKLMLMAAGKPRTGAAGELLLQSMFNNAKTLINPGSLFNGEGGMPVKAVDIADHVVSAFTSGLSAESDVLSALTCMKGVTQRHTDFLAHGRPKLGRGATFSDVMAVFRDFSVKAVKVAVLVNSSRGDSTGASLKAVDRVLAEL
jgi:hypothetical protein